MRTQVTTPGGPAVVELERPDRPARALLVLTHGANGGVETPDLCAIRDSTVRADIAVARVLQPYRVAGRTSSPPATQDEAWLAAVAVLRRRTGLGGSTPPARQCALA